MQKNFNQIAGTSAAENLSTAPKESFNQSAGISETERALQALEIEYRKLPGGYFLVPGNIDLNMQGLTELPDLTNVIVKGNFECICNNLTSLKGAPKYVGGDFLCIGNELTSLKYAPRYVGGNFECYSNELTSLKGGPRIVGGTVNTHECPLPNLEYAPQKFERLVTRVVTFSAWDEVPRPLQMSSETRKRREDEAVLANTVLQNIIRVTKPLSLKMTSQQQASL